MSLFFPTQTMSYEVHPHKTATVPVTHANTHAPWANQPTQALTKAGKQTPAQTHTHANTNVYMHARTQARSCARQELRNHVSKT